MTQGEDKRAGGDDPAIEFPTAKLRRPVETDGAALSGLATTDVRRITGDVRVSRREVGRYQIIGEAGRGGMGVVYVARQIGPIDRCVALKELSASAAADPTFAERFAREGAIAGRLSHPNIVVILEYFVHGETPYIAMEYLEHGSLRPYVGKLSLAQIGGVLDGALSGLDHAQNEGVIHRDLKPENLLVTGEGAIKIGDFGIARALGDTTLTRTGEVFGSPAYMAPEQWTGGEIGPWTDLYATGTIAYELLTGRRPFVDADPMELLKQKVTDVPPPARTINPQLDRQLAEWLSRMLERQPNDRPTAREAREELEDVLLGLIGPRWRRDASVIHGAAAARPLEASSRSDESRAPVLLEGVRTLEALMGCAERSGGGCGTASDAMFEDSLARIGSLVDELHPGDACDAARRAHDALRAYSSLAGAPVTASQTQLEAARARVDEFVAAAHTVLDDSAAGSEQREGIIQRLRDEAGDLLRLARLGLVERAVPPGPAARWYVSSYMQWMSADMVALGLVTPPEWVAAGRGALAAADDLWQLVLLGAPPEERERQVDRVEAAVMEFEALLRG